MNLYHLSLNEPPRPGTDQTRITEQHHIEAETAYKAILVLRSNVRPAFLRCAPNESVLTAEHLTYPLSGDRYWSVDRVADGDADALRARGVKILNAKPATAAVGEKDT